MLTYRFKNFMYIIINIFKYVLSIWALVLRLQLS